MQIVNTEFSELVLNLFNELKSEDCVEFEEFRLAKELQALPIGYDLISFVFIKADGEIIWSDFLDDEITKIYDTQALIRAIVHAAKRYPQFEKFIPERPENAEVCIACNGTKLFGKDVLTNQPARCVICAGLGWIIKGEQK